MVLEPTGEPTTNRRAQSAVVVPLKSARHLDGLATEIRQEHDACEQNAHTAVRHAVRAGELLTQAKASVGHGAWGGWLADNFPGSQQLAAAYMRLAASSDELKAPSSIRQALRQIAAPRVNRAEVASVEPSERAVALAAMVKKGGQITTHPPQGPCRAHKLLADAGLTPKDPAAWQLLIDKGYTFTTVRTADENGAPVEPEDPAALIARKLIDLGDAFKNTNEIMELEGVDRALALKTVKVVNRVTLPVSAALAVPSHLMRDVAKSWDVAEIVRVVPDETRREWAAEYRAAAAELRRIAKLLVEQHAIDILEDPTCAPP